MKTVKLDDVDRNLLNILQMGFPLTREPYADIASKLSLTEKDVIKRIARLKDGQIIRTIGPIFDLRNLGYHSTLVAMRVPPRRLEQAAEIISQHPGVSHNYQRNHHYNLWFTLSLSGNVERQEVLLRLQTQVKPTIMFELPAVRIFKIKTIFDMQGENNAADEIPAQPQKVSPLNPEEWALINELQRDIPLVSKPFNAIADHLGMEVDALLEQCRTFQDQGIMRRFGASIKHSNAGFTANAMVAWQVPQESAEDIGHKMVSYKEVSHCYERKTNSHWPYNMFTMIHGKTRKDCQRVIDEISAEISISEYECLFSVKEFKKIRMRYQSQDAQQRKSSYYPIYLDITGKRCVVIGGGDVASRKVDMLLDCGAQVEVISPVLCPELDTKVANGTVKATLKEYKHGDLKGVFVVIAATDELKVNERIAQEAMERGILINVVDAPKLSNFIVPSYMRRGDMTIAISTSGKSPALARKIRTELEKKFSEEYAALALLLSEVRSELKQRMIKVSSEAWQQALDLDMLLELLRSGQRDEAKRRLLDILEGQSE